MPPRLRAPGRVRLLATARVALRTASARPWILAALLGSITFGPTLRAQNPRADKPVLYVIGTAHLDSQWNRTVQDTIRRFVAPTFVDNFKLFERFPRYAFNYEGAIHYMWFSAG